MKEKDLLSELSELRRTVEGFFVSKNPLMSMADPGWRPPTDVFDMPEHTLVRMEIAGMNREDIEVELEGNRLTIRGHRRNRTRPGSPPRCCRQMEIKYASFERRVVLGSSFSGAEVKAVYRDGFLEVRVPTRKESPKRTKINVNVQKEPEKL